MRGGPARVLEALRSAGSGSTSGAALSNELGRTRAQVWKHVEALRELGYEIDAAAGEGYRLASVPDRLYPEELLRGLDTRWLARDLRWFDSVDSTNRIAQELAREGAAHGTSVIAEGQTAGRGRLGRTFFSPPYQNLYTSIVLRPRLTTAEAPSWILAAAIAVAEAVEASVPDPDAVEIKWPNDVLLGGLKTSGILMELSAEASQVEYLVLGIGVNLNVDRKSFPDEFRHLATSLASHNGTPVDRLDFARRLYTRLEEVLDRCAEAGFDAVRAAFEARFRMAGRRIVALELGGEELEGIALGIDKDGALRVACDDGTETRVIAGDVTLAKEPT
ncbi:MAG: biotin--[acetyl-CoA-carboxylase] ligase [Deltaproteobacteria bacterium]|nr:biotin--[acetyl-CoA-carboxylase] ligase [Deltaproteobacteria bacterium]MBW2362134.1 biotin--[acetyl-CoA-carboxylase] ligase [Deltaproteobacteria bacterium]